MKRELIAKRLLLTFGIAGIMLVILAVIYFVNDIVDQGEPLTYETVAEDKLYIISKKNARKTVDLFAFAGTQDYRTKRGVFRDIMDEPLWEKYFAAPNKEYPQRYVKSTVTSIVTHIESTDVFVFKINAQITSESMIDIEYLVRVENGVIIGITVL